MTFTEKENPIVEAIPSDATKAALTLYAWPYDSGNIERNWRLYEPVNQYYSSQAFGLSHNGSYATIPSCGNLYFRGPKLFDIRTTDSSEGRPRKNSLDDCDWLKTFADHIKPVYKATGGSREQGINNMGLQYSIHKYFIPSLIECLGNTSFVQTNSYYSPDGTQTEGQKYDLGGKAFDTNSFASTSFNRGFLYRSPDVRHENLWMGQISPKNYNTVVIEGCGEGNPPYASNIRNYLGVIPFFCI